MSDQERRVIPGMPNQLAACIASCGTGALLGGVLGAIAGVVSGFVIQPMWFILPAFLLVFGLVAGAIEGMIAGLLSGLLSSIMTRFWPASVMRLLVTPMLCALLMLLLGFLATAVIQARSEPAQHEVDRQYAEATFACLAMWHSVAIPFIGLIAGLIAGSILASSRQHARV